MKQKLTLEIDRVMLLRAGAPDKLTLSIICPEVLDAITKEYMVGDTSYSELFGKTLDFEIQIAAGAGEKLADHLGLRIDETVEV